jgi:hypothetical protein
MRAPKQEFLAARRDGPRPGQGRLSHAAKGQRFCGEGTAAAVPKKARKIGALASEGQEFEYEM